MIGAPLDKQRLRQPVGWWATTTLPKEIYAEQWDTKHTSNLYATPWHQNLLKNVSEARITPSLPPYCLACCRKCCHDRYAYVCTQQDTRKAQLVIKRPGFAIYGLQVRVPLAAGAFLVWTFSKPVTPNCKRGL